MTLKNFSDYDKFKLISLCIKAATGVIGGSMILQNTRPYATLIVCALGAVANEVVNFIKEKETPKPPQNEGTEN
jgi:hypothetical protein